jgi:hypothetical protein
MYGLKLISMVEYTPVPVLGSTGIALLLALLAGFAWVSLRRHIV